MSTVGEMVNEGWRDHIAEWEDDAPLGVLRALGIWDAEVQECVAEVDEYNREVLSFLEGQPFARLHIDPYGATRKPVRVIVLKGE